MKAEPLRESRIGKCCHLDDEGRLCRRTAVAVRDIFQTTDHEAVGTGWFKVPLCAKHAREPK